MHEFQEQLNLSKLAILNKKHFAFIGSMLYKLKIEPDSSIKDIYLDNNTIKINPNWFINLTPEHSASMLAHEVLHYSLQHDLRGSNRLQDIYQKACDQVVNNLLLDFNFKLPDNIQVDRRFQNQSLDVVYKYIKADYDKNNDSNLPQYGDSDLPIEPTIIDTSQLNQRNRNINEADTTNMLSGSKSIGSSSEAFKELFENINSGKLDWRQILQEHFNELTAGEPSYHELDRRMLSMGYYEPVNESNTYHRVAIALDVSSSVTKEQVHSFLKEIKAIVNSLNPEVISIMTFNREVVDVFELKAEDSFNNINIRIGGGTSFEPVFNYYNQLENYPEFLVVFSDLEVHSFPDKPTYLVTWICFDNPNIDLPIYGKTIHVNSKDLYD